MWIAIRWKTLSDDKQDDFDEIKEIYGPLKTEEEVKTFLSDLELGELGQELACYINVITYHKLTPIKKEK